MYDEYMKEEKRDNFSGDDNEEATPVPIPNTAVKLICAEDTCLATDRKNR